MMAEKIKDCQNANDALLEEVQKLFNHAVAENKKRDVKYLSDFCEFIEIHIEILAENEKVLVKMTDPVQK